MRVHARPLFLRTVLQILFRISQSNDKKGNPKNQDLDFLIEIHLEDGFLGGEIRFRISRSIGKLDFENLNPDFPIERTLGFVVVVRVAMRFTAETCRYSSCNLFLPRRGES